MTGLIPAAGSPVTSAFVDGVNVDAIAAAVRGCGAVDDLSSGRWGEVASYLPGRRVAGVQVGSDQVTISVRGRWGVPVTELARQVRVAVTAVAGPRRVDIVITDLAEPAPASRAGRPAAGTHGDEVSSWTTSSAAGTPGARTSAPAIPTAAATRPPSPPA
jgi:hypothetical protein